MLDLHVHADPSLFPRARDAEGLARDYALHGFEGFVLKMHHGSSAEAAALLRSLHPELRIEGGIVLNAFVGGLNPYAVDAALTLGARMVWLPTIHAAAHEKACGCLGGFEFQRAATRLQLGEGLTIVDASGGLKPEVHEILDLLDGSGAALATGHVGREEVRVLHAAMRERRVDVPLVLNHVFFDVPAFPLDELEPFVGDGVYFELVELSQSVKVGATSFEAVREALLARPDGNWILASDGGQAGRPPPAEALTSWVERLREGGVSDTALERYTSRHPLEVLGGSG